SSARWCWLSAGHPYFWPRGLLGSCVSRLWSHWPDSWHRKARPMRGWLDHPLRPKNFAPTTSATRTDAETSSGEWNKVYVTSEASSLRLKKATRTTPAETYRADLRSSSIEVQQAR